MKTILFYSALPDMSYFINHSFYANTIDVLEKAGFKVIPCINIKEAWSLEYDGILCFFYRKGVIPALLAKLRGKKIFFTGGTDNLDKDFAPFKSWLLQVVLFKLCRWIADSCLVESHSDLTNMKKVCLREPHNLHYCPQAMPLEKYKSDLTKKEDCFTTICWQERTGNVLRKGVDKALYLFKFLTQFPQYSRFKFYILGRTGEGTDVINKIVAELGLKDKVIITGAVSEEDKIERLKKSRYFFQLSSYEGFGLAALEAEAAGCVMIHSGKGGLADVCGNDGLRIDLSTFDYSIEKFSPTITEKLLAIGNKEIDEMLSRIYNTFDEHIRVQNFKKYIGSYLIER